MPVVFGPSDDTASLIGMILSLDITKWAQEYFQKPLSVNVTVMIQKCRLVLWAKAHLKWTVSKVFYGQTSPNLTLLLENHRQCVLRAKEEGDLPVCYQHSVQKPASLMVWGCISAYVVGSLHVLEGTMNAERYIKVLEQQMLPSRLRLFQGRPCVFQQDNAKPHTAAIITAWLRSRIVSVLNWTAGTFTYREHLEQHLKIRQRWPRTLHQLEAYIRQ